MTQGEPRRNFIHVIIKSHSLTSLLPLWLVISYSDSTKQNAPLPRVKLQIAPSLNIVGNTWEKRSKYLNKIHQKGRVVSRYFNTETHLTRVISLKRPNCSLSFYRTESKVHISVRSLSSDKSWVQQQANFPETLLPAICGSLSSFSVFLLSSLKPPTADVF